MSIVTVRLIAKIYVPTRVEDPNATPTVDEIAAALVKHKNTLDGYAVCVDRIGTFTSNIVIQEVEVLDNDLPKLMRKTACARTDPDKVVDELHRGANPMIPVDGTCTACRQPWDRSHLLVIYDVLEVPDGQQA